MDRCVDRVSAYGPGCVKSRTGEKCVESISLLPLVMAVVGTIRLSDRRNREGSSKRKLNFRFFTQPGSPAEMLNARMTFPVFVRLASVNWGAPGRKPRAKSCRDRHDLIVWSQRS